MENEPLAFHYHKFGVNIESYYKSQEFQNEFKILQTDTYCDQAQSNKNITFIVAMEARNYPFWATLYHPELQSIDYQTSAHWETRPSKVTDEIAYRVSR